MAHAEGAAAAWAIAVDGLDTDDAMGARKRITDVLLRGADDTWSGRTNDTLRAYADGFRDAARDALAALDLV